MLRAEHQVKVAPGDPSPEPLRHLPFAMFLEEVQERGRTLEGELAAPGWSYVLTAWPNRAASPAGFRILVL